MRRASLFLTGRASHCLPGLLVAMVPCNVLLPGLLLQLPICRLLQFVLLAFPLPLRGSRGRSSRLSSLLRLHPLLRFFAFSTRSGSAGS